MSERSGESPMERPETPNEGIDASAKHLRKTVGLPRQPIPSTLTRPEMHERALSLARDNVIADLHEMFEWSRLRLGTKSIDMQAALEDPVHRPSLDMLEFSAVRDGLTYAEYLDTVVEHTTATIERYRALKESVSTVPVDFAAKEPLLRAFADDLDTRLEQRLLFANAALAQYQLQSQRDLKGVVQLNQRALLTRLEKDILPKLDTSSAEILQKGDSAELQKKMNELDQRIVELLAKDGQLPGELVLGLLSQAYSDNIRREQTAVRGHMKPNDETRLKRLIAKNDRAANGEGESLTPQEQLEYQRLQRLSDLARSGSEGLRGDRRRLTDDIHATIDQLADFHVTMSSLTAVRNQLKISFPLDGAMPADCRATPNENRVKIAEMMQARKEFHLQRLDRYAERFNDEVLDVTMKDRIEALSNTSGREFLRFVSNNVAALYTLAVPEAVGLKDMAQKALAGPLQESLGWPADQLDAKFEDLDSETQQRIMEKATSIKYLVERFDRSKVRNLRESVAVLRSLPVSTVAAGQEVRDPLPVERVTQANVEELTSNYGVATVFIMATRQLDRDWDGGDEDGVEGGLLAEQRTFFEGINKNLDTHFDVATALYEQSGAWRNVMYGIIAAAGGVVALQLWNKWKVRRLKATNARLTAENQSLSRAYRSATDDREALRSHVDRVTAERERAMTAQRRAEEDLNNVTFELDEVRLRANRLERLRSLEQESSELSKQFDAAFEMKDLSQRAEALEVCVNRAKALQAEMQLFEGVEPSARRVIAENILKFYDVQLTDDVWNVIKQMHEASTIDEKMKILLEAKLTPVQTRACKKLMRTGIAGQTAVADEVFDVVGKAATVTRSGGSVGEFVVSVPPGLLDDAAAVSDDLARANAALKAAKASDAVVSGLVAIGAFVDMYLLYDVEMRLQEARKGSDADAITQLENQRYTMAVSSVGTTGLGVAGLLGVSGWVTGPGAIVLAGGTWYADGLYGHARELDASTPQENMKKSSSDLLHVLRTTKRAALTDGADTPAILRGNALEALLRKHVPIVARRGREADALSAAVRPGMAVADFCTRVRKGQRGTFDVTDPLAQTDTKSGGLDIVESALEVSRVFAARDALRAAGKPLKISYEPKPGVIQSIDLGLLPTALTAERSKENESRMMAVATLAREYDRYELFRLRSAFLARGSAAKSLKGDKGWSEACDWVRPYLLQRLALPIADAEDRVKHAFTGTGFDLKRDVALYELRMDLQRIATHEMVAMMNGEQSSEALEAMERSIAQSLLLINPIQLYNDAEARDMSSERFNPMKYAIDHMDTSVGGPLLLAENLDQRLAPVRAGKAALEKKIGVSLERCVGALIDTPRP